ncbi:MAG: OsmC family protein [Gammaproteobacteria bacterium]|nr:OsmC family protein [Gammaproteobacteria bacterium]
MSEFRVSIDWEHAGGEFAPELYDRSHRIRFGGGQEIHGSAAPEYFGKAEYANPEETLAASVSACHMLTFLALCAKKRLPVASYRDEAVAELGKNAAGKLCVTRIVLHPEVRFAGEAPGPEALAQLHERAHGACFIANSISAEVAIVSV